MVKIHLAAPNADGHFGKAVNVMVHNILKDRRHRDRKARAVSAVVKRRKLVLDSVAVPVLASANAAGIVVRHHSGPHDVGPGLIVVGVGDNARRLMLHRKKKRLDKAVCNLNVLCVGQIALVKVRHDVCHASRRLEGRKRLRESRIQNAELGADSVTVGAALEHAFLFCDYRIGASFASGGGDCQNRSDRQSLFYQLAAVKIPKVSVVQNAGRDRFGGIYSASAADGEDKVNAFFFAKVDSLVDKAASWVGLNASQFHKRKSCGL